MDETKTSFRWRAFISCISRSSFFHLASGLHLTVPLRHSHLLPLPSSPPPPSWVTFQHSFQSAVEEIKVLHHGTSCRAFSRQDSQADTCFTSVNWHPGHSSPRLQLSNQHMLFSSPAPLISPNQVGYDQHQYPLHSPPASITAQNSSSIALSSLYASSCSCSCSFSFSCSSSCSSFCFCFFFFFFFFFFLFFYCFFFFSFLLPTTTTPPPPPPPPPSLPGSIVYFKTQNITKRAKLTVTGFYHETVMSDNVALMKLYYLTPSWRNAYSRKLSRRNAAESFRNKERKKTHVQDWHRFLSSSSIRFCLPASNSCFHLVHKFSCPTFIPTTLPTSLLL